MALWTAGILLALGLVWSVGTVVVSVQQVHKVAANFESRGMASRCAEKWVPIVKELARGQACPHDRPASGEIEGLGDSETAARRLRLYLRLPRFCAPNQSTAVLLLGRTCDRTRAQDVPRLIRLLNSEDEDMRLAAAIALGWIGDCRAVEPLLAMLGDNDALVRKVAVDSLGLVGDARAVEGIGDVLKGDAVEENRASAAWALGRIGGEQSLGLLIGALSDKGGEVRYAAVTALGDMKDIRALQPLLNVYGQVNMDRLQRSLAGLGSEAVPQLLEAFERHPRESVRHLAACVLGDIKDPRAIEPLIAALSRSDIYSSAQEALVRIGEPALEPLMRAMTRGDKGFRIRVISALDRFRSPKTIGALMTALRDEDGEVRRIALQALVQVGDSRCAEAVKGLLATDEDCEVRRVAAEALGRFGDPGGVDALESALGDKYSLVRVNAACALGKFGPRAARAVPALEGLSEDKDEKVRQAALDALRKIRGKEAPR
jgi:HEAT repeat protein